MMTHNRSHNHCVHANVKFCSCCNLVYCVNCGKEWREQPTHWLYPTYPTQPEKWTITCGNTYTIDAVSASDDFSTTAVPYHHSHSE